MWHKAEDSCLCKIKVNVKCCDSSGPQKCSVYNVLTPWSTRNMLRFMLSNYNIIVEEKKVIRLLHSLTSNAIITAIMLQPCYSYHWWKVLRKCKYIFFILCDKGDLSMQQIPLSCEAGWYTCLFTTQTSLSFEACSNPILHLECSENQVKYFHLSFWHPPLWSGPLSWPHPGWFTWLWRSLISMPTQGNIKVMSVLLLHASWYVYAIVFQ